MDKPIAILAVIVLIISWFIPEHKKCGAILSGALAVCAYLLYKCEKGAEASQLT